MELRSSLLRSPARTLATKMASPFNMSDQDQRKKMLGEMELDPFLEEHAIVTGQQLQVVSSAESPDFVCIRPGGP
jgi:hypothetical protein